MSKKISLFVPSLRGGGAERVTLALANGISEAGHDVDLVLAKAEGPFLADISAAVNVVDLKAHRVAQSILPLANYLKKTKPTALLSAMNHTNIAAIIAHRLARTPTRLLISEHNTLSASKPKNLHGRLVPPLMRVCYPYADEVIAVSKGVADDLAHSIDLPTNNLRVIYNPVVSPRLLDLSQENVEHPWLQPGQPPTIIGVGRLTEQKDFSNLINAFTYVRARKFVRLLILGEGELRPKLEKIIAETGMSQDIALVGFVKNPYSWIRRSSLFVLSSQWEGLPTVLIEAMACGTPVVSTDCPSGPAEILENGYWGSLAPVGDPEKLADAIISTLNSPTRPNVSIRAANFSIENAVNGYLEAFKVSRPEPQKSAA